MTLQHTFLAGDAAERHARAVQLCRRCLLLLQERRAGAKP